MGIFSGQTKADMREDPRPMDQGSKAFDELPSLPKPQANTVVAKGITVTGDLRGEGVVQIEGCLDGSIEVKGSVTVAGAGLMQGPIVTDVVRVAGHVKGAITAHSHLRLERTGSIEGDVSAASLVIEDGGRLDGRSTMLTPPAQEAGSYAWPDSDEELQFGPNYQAGEGSEELL